MSFILDFYDYISNAFYIGIFLSMMDFLFKRKKHISTIVYYTAPVIVFWIIYYFPQYALGHPTIAYYYYFCTLIAICLFSIAFLLEGSFVEKLIYLLYYFTVYKCVVFFLGGTFYEKEPKMDKELYAYLNVLSTFLPVTVLYFFRKFCIKYELHTLIKYLQKNQVALMLYCPFSIFTSFQLADPSLHIPYTVYISLSAVLLVFNVPIFYYLFAEIGKSNESRIDMGRALAETAAQLSRYRYSLIREEEAKKERHELKNKYFYIQTLLKENKLQQLESFLAEHIGELTSNDSNVYTNNSLIDYIINTKLALAKKHNIKTYSEVLIPEKLNINEEYFCTILLNLFDNAIEASQQEANPDIQIYLNTKNQYLVFCIKNKVSFDVLEQNPSLKTSKKDPRSHGLGIKIIKRAVRNANGIFDTSMESGYFVATVMVPIL